MQKLDISSTIQFYYNGNNPKTLQYTRENEASKWHIKNYKFKCNQKD